MFRIKNFRSSTVAKQNQISPVPIKAQPIPSNTLQSKKDHKKQETRFVIPYKNPQQQRFPQRPEQKLRTPKPDHKLKLVSKAHIEEVGKGKRLENFSLHLKHPSIGGNRKSDAKGIVYPKSLKKVQHSGCQKGQERQYFEVSAKIQQSGKQEEKQESEIYSIEGEQLQHFIEKEEVKQKINEQLIWTQEQERTRLEGKQREITRQRLKEEEARREQELKQMMQKVQKRRRVREEQKQKCRKLEEARAQLLRQQQSSGKIAGMVTLNDPLAHVEMSQILMDKQVQMLINMKFPGYPNQQAIQHQIQELDRINRSYLMTRENPSNSLVSGLANFRIELFNRVGELIMEGQRQMGPSSTGLRVVPANHLSSSPVRGVAITRGLEGHVQRLLKNILLPERDQCPICLHRMEKGEQVYQVNCGHHFHKKCLEEWLANTANCPVCRYNIKFDHH